MSDIAISVKDVTKLYKLYDKPSDRLKESLGLSRKKKFNEHYALNNLSFDIKKGECVGIIGTNGAGKSTILKIITGVLSPTSGEVEIDGRISALLELGAGFNMEYTGIENVYLNGTMIGFSKEEIDAKLDDILAFADIGDYVNQPVKMYSSGMFVRLAFAVAINIEPEILIVDEALSVGDVFFQAKCFKKFEEFKKQGKTILFVSHDLSSISKYCDRVVLLNKGHKVDEGIPKDMISIFKRLLVGKYNDPYESTNENMDIIDAIEDSKNASGKNKSGNNATGKISSGDNSTGKNPSGDNESGSNTSNENASDADDKNLWKSNYKINPDLDEYGDGTAYIMDFAVVDNEGNITNSILKGTDFKIKSKVKFFKDIDDPIFTFTFKDIHGTAITGTNTMYEKVNIMGGAKNGETYVATFEQTMNLQGGEYLLSISCTGYADGEFKVYNRLYDVISITVISDQDTVGFYDMFSKTRIDKCEE